MWTFFDALVILSSMKFTANSTLLSFFIFTDALPLSVRSRAAPTTWIFSSSLMYSSSSSYFVWCAQKYWWEVREFDFVYSCCYLSLHPCILGTENHKIPAYFKPFILSSDILDPFLFPDLPRIFDENRLFIYESLPDSFPATSSYQDFSLR